MKKNHINWMKIKTYINNAARIIIFSVVMLVGFWTVYLMLWNALGFPITTNAVLLLLIQAVISETMFIKWFNKYSSLVTIQ